MPPETDTIPKSVLRLEDFIPQSVGGDLHQMQVRMSRLNMRMSALEVTDPSYEVFLDEFIHLADEYRIKRLSQK
jgi:hypothetical protein